MSRTRVVRSVALCVLLLCTSPGFALAQEPIPFDDPFVQQSIRTGTQAAGARIRGEAVGKPAQGAGGGIASIQGTDSAIEGFVSYTIDEPSMEILLPAEWRLETRTSDGLFGVTIPGEFAFSFFDSFGDESFPGLFGMAIFLTQADALVGQIDESIRVRGVDTFTTMQEYPFVRILFGGNMDGIDVAGGFYLLAGPGDIYALMMITSDATWLDIRDSLDTTVQNIRFLDSVGVGLVRAGDDPMPYTTQNSSGLELTLPAHWLLQETTDEDVPFVIADPDLLMAAAVAIPPVAMDADELEALRSQLLGDPDQVDLESMASELFSAMDMNMDLGEVEFDPALTVIYPDAGPTVLFGGSGSFDEMVVPLLIYVNLGVDTLRVAIAMGDLEQMQSQADTIVDLLQGLSAP